MRVDCYNACECLISELEYGDTFYYLGALWIKVNLGVALHTESDKTAIVDLATGELDTVLNSTRVVMADTKVVANTKDTF